MRRTLSVAALATFTLAAWCRFDCTLMPRVRSRSAVAPFTSTPRLKVTT